MSSSKLSPTASNVSACTEIKVEHFTYEWVITEFKHLPQKNGSHIYSPIFSMANNTVEWKLRLYPRGYDSENTDYVALYLQLHSWKAEAIEIKSHVKLSILPSGITRQLAHTYVKTENSGFSRMIERSELLKASEADDTVTVRCEIGIAQETITRPIEITKCMEQALDSRGGQMIRDFRQLFKEPKLSDVTVIVGKKKFPAHKVVLVARSPVFSEIFQRECSSRKTRDNLQNEVRVEGIEPDVVKAMLEFFYTDEVPNLAELVYGLLGAADKYDVRHLKSMCEEVLYKTLNKENAAEILVHADRHRSHKLKQHVVEFMDNHLMDVVGSESYKGMKDPEVLKDFIRSFAIGQKSKDMKGNNSAVLGTTSNMSSSELTDTTNNVSVSTDVKVEHFAHEWIIRQFKFLPKENSQFINSPTFRMVNNEVEWALCFYLQGCTKDNADHASIVLRLCSHKSEKVKVTAEVKFLILPIGVTKTLVWTYDAKGGRGFPKMIKRSELLESCASDDTIIIRTTIDMSWETITEAIDTKACVKQSLDSHGSHFMQDFRLLFKELRVTDVTVIVGNKKFPAHKVVLAARSPVFSAMFEHERSTKKTQKNIRNEVKIEKIEPAVVGAMLEFFYTDEVTNLEELVYGLLGAADKYDVQQLKSMCEKILYKKLNNETAAKILAHADLHRSYQLKEHVMSFMNDHILDVVESESYKDIKDAELLKQFFTSFAVRQKSKKIKLS